MPVPRFRQILSNVRSAHQRFGLLGVADRILRALRTGGLGEIRRRYSRFASGSTSASSTGTAPLGRQPARPLSHDRLGGLDPDRLRLGDDFGVDQRSWDRYLELVTSTPPGAHPASGRQPKAGPHLLVSVHAESSLNADALGRTVASVTSACRRRSIHAELCLLADRPTRAAPGPEPEEQIKVYPTLRDLAAQLADGNLVLFLKPGDEIHETLPEALLRLGKCDAALMLIDLYFEEAGRIYPLLLPAADPVHGLACDYFHSRFATTTDLLRRAVLESQAADPYGVARSTFRDVQRENPPRLSHLAVPLIRCALTREQIAHGRSALLQRAEEERMALLTAETRHDVNGGSVSAVISTRDNGYLLRQLVRALLKEPLIKEVLIVSNQTSNPCAIQTLELLSKHPRVTILRYDQAFNFSRQSNLGARYAAGEELLFVNDDIVPATEGWLDVLHGWLAETPRRIVGPLLLYPDETVQHGGMFLGFRNTAGHTLRGAALPEGDYGYLLSAPRRVSCLTGAAMLVGKGLFDSLNGFDPLLGTYLQDVDLCLRAMYSGADLIFDPRAILFHMESVSLKPGLRQMTVQVGREREYDYFRARWSNDVSRDRYLNPLFDPTDESLRSLRW